MPGTLAGSGARDLARETPWGCLSLRLLADARSCETCCFQAPFYTYRHKLRGRPISYFAFERHLIGVKRISPFAPASPATPHLTEAAEVDPSITPL